MDNLALKKKKSLIVVIRNYVSSGTYLAFHVYKVKYLY